MFPATSAKTTFCCGEWNWRSASRKVAALSAWLMRWKASAVPSSGRRAGHDKASTAPVSLESSGTTRSDERRLGEECVSTCRYRWSPYQQQTKKLDYQNQTQEYHKKR